MYGTSYKEMMSKMQQEAKAEALENTKEIYYEPHFYENVQKFTTIRGNLETRRHRRKQSSRLRVDAWSAK